MAALIDIMEEKGELDKVTSRRSRKDEEGRDFMCGCGKRYLSYPALYTHIKTKHDGRQPEGTLKSASLKRHKPKFEEDTLRSLYALLPRAELQVLEELGEAAAGRVALAGRIKKEGVRKEVFESYLWLMRQGEVRLLPSSPLETALAVFLLNVGEHVNEKVYEQFLLFSHIARDCFHEHGEEVFRAYFAKPGVGPFTLPHFSVQEVRYFPIVCDFALQSYVPATYDTAHLSLSLLQLILFDFCNWLYRRKLTPIRASFARDFKLDYKPPPSKARHARHDQKEAEPCPPFEEDSEELSELEELEEDAQAEPKPNK